MRLGIWMDVGIFEKSRRLRIARISLLLDCPDMLSPETYRSRPPGGTRLHPMERMQIASDLREVEGGTTLRVCFQLRVTPGWRLPPSIATAPLREMSCRIRTSHSLGWTTATLSNYLT